ncbi:MAG: hypothetical protein U0791_27435 [Gemmataceae bacterium]
MARNDDDDDMLDLYRSRRERKAAARQLRLVLVGGLLFFFAIAGLTIAFIVKSQRSNRDVVTEQPQTPSPEGTSRHNNIDAPVPRTTECKFGDWVGSGHFQVRILDADSRAHIQGVRGGDGDRRNLTILFLEGRNTHAGRIVEWAGWQGVGEIEDEFGNKFKPADGWSVIYPGLETWANDFPKRIPPTTGEPVKAVLYFERVPATSKKLTVTLPLEGVQLRFQGKHG